MDQLLRDAIYLACPVSMGLMMWWMMRGHSPSNRDQEASVEAQRITQLEREVEELRRSSAESEHQALTRR